MTTRISVLGAIALLLTTAAAAAAQRHEAWIDEALVAEFQARSATLSAALEQVDAPVLDSLVAPAFEAALGLEDGAVFHVPRSSWLRLQQPKEIAVLDERVIIARRQGDMVIVTSLRGPQLRPRYLVTDVWSRVGNSWQLVWRSRAVISHGSP